MIHTRTLWIAAGLLVAAGAGVAVGATFSQEPQDAAVTMLKPGPEHEFLKMDSGSWNATVKIWTAPGVPPMEMMGKEINKLDCNGMWMITSFDMPDGSFSGRGMSGWDAQKKQYVSVWVDSESTYMSTSTGTFDKSKHAFSFTGEQLDKATGKMIKNRSTAEYPDANTRKFTAWSTPAGGKEVKGMEITYTRSK